MGERVAGSFESLEEIRRNRSNVAVRCGFCEHRGVVDGGILWRWFALHHWDSRPPDVIENMRCTICRRRPVDAAAPFEELTIDFGPRAETDWQEGVARRRYSAIRQPDSVLGETRRAPG